MRCLLTHLYSCFEISHSLLWLGFPSTLFNFSCLWPIQTDFFPGNGFPTRLTVSLMISWNMFHKRAVRQLLPQFVEIFISTAQCNKHPLTDITENDVAIKNSPSEFNFHFTSLKQKTEKWPNSCCSGTGIKFLSSLVFPLLFSWVQPLNTRFPFLGKYLARLEFCLIQIEFSSETCYNSETFHGVDKVFLSQFFLPYLTGSGIPHWIEAEEAMENWVWMPVNKG